MIFGGGGGGCRQCTLDVLQSMLKLFSLMPSYLFHCFNMRYSSLLKFS